MEILTKFLFQPDFTEQVVGGGEQSVQKLSVQGGFPQIQTRS